MLAAAYVDGIQSKGIAACIKHFVANDMEDDRIAVDSVISPRALREIYLYPYAFSLPITAKNWSPKHLRADSCSRKSMQSHGRT